MTKYEKAIYELIASSRSHMTAEQIYAALKPRYPTIVLATVYNNLKKLSQSEMVRKVIVEGQPDRYDRKTRHDHLICADCGALLDIDLGDLTRQFQEHVPEPLLGYDLRLLYCCEACRRKRADNPEEGERQP